MAKTPKKPAPGKAVEAPTYPKFKRKNIPTAEYQLHDQNWTNRMILGDSLQVMAQ